MKFQNGSAGKQKEDRHAPYARGLRLVFPPFLLAVMLTVALYAFLKRNNQLILDQNMIYMENAAKQTAERVDNVLSNTEHSLTTVVELYGRLMENPEPDMQLLRDIADDTLFDYVEYADRSGQVLTADGQTAQVYRRFYFQSGMAGESGVDVVYHSSITDETLVAFYTPLYYRGRIMGVLTGHYRADRVAQILEGTYFGEDAVTLLCENDGTIIASSGTTDTFDNVIDVSGNDRMDEASREKLLSALKNRESYGYTFEGREGTTNAYLVHLANEDWSVVQVFPSAVTGQMTRRVNRVGLLLELEIVLAFGAYVAWLMLTSRSERRRLAREKNEMERIVEGVNRLFTRFVLINLDKETYRYLEDNSDLPSKIARRGAYDDFVRYFSGRILETMGEVRLQDALTALYLRTHLTEEIPYLRFEFCIQRGEVARWENAALVCLERKDGVPASVLFAIQDVTELREAEARSREALKEAFQAAKEASSAKSDFLSRMSHDIRTPMNAVMGMTAIALMHIDDPERVKDCLNKISVSGRHLLSLINEVLDMSRIESGKVSLSETSFVVQDCLNEVLDMLRLRVQEKELKLTVSTEGIRHGQVTGDFRRLQRMFLNIMMNAVKFTPEGGSINVRLSERTSSMQGTACYEFVCEDTGVGMSEEFMSELFEPFARAHDSRTEKTEGVGLGLPIARSIARLMGGDIRVESRLGEGSRFTAEVVLKLPEDAERVQAQEEIPLGAVSFEGKHILLVEDNELNAEIALEFLQGFGLEADTVDNGQKAVELLLSSGNCSYDLVFMDIQMPVMNGYAATRAIRASGRADLEQLPIVAMTADAFQEDVARARAAGMNGHLAKPIDAAQLAGVLRKWLG